MRRTSIIVFAALLSVAGIPAAASAQLCIRVPLVSIHVGPGGCGCYGGVHIRAPFVNIHVPRRRYVVLPACADNAGPATTSRDTFNVSTSRAAEPSRRKAAQALTLTELAEQFKPAAGEHEVLVVHPVTRAPTPVKFTLPAGTPLKVRALPRQIVFRYDNASVRLRFLRDGQVDVIAR